MSINVQLPQFEGPLSLLLYLIRKEEMNIMDINVHAITKQYLEYIKLMRELDLEIAGEFVAMASTLIHIKSRMLLPQYDENGDVVEQEDPRKELVAQLIEYQKYQEAAKLIYERPLVGRDVLLRGTREVLEKPTEEVELEENALFALISSYRRVMKTLHKRVHKVSARALSISARILQIKDQLVPGQKVTLFGLIESAEEKSKALLITFLSLLELARMGYVRLFQAESFSDIWIDPLTVVETDVISRVEEFDNVNAESVAEDLMRASENENEKEELRMVLEAEAASDEAMPNSIAISEQVIGQELESQDNELAADSPNLSEIASDDEIENAEKELFGKEGDHG